MRSNEAKFFLLLVVSLCLSTAGLPAPAQSGRRVEVAQSIARQYGLTEIGSSLLGIRGGRDSIRQAGGVVTLMRGELSGSLDADLTASYAIRDGSAEFFRGAKDRTFSAGETFYVHSVYAGSDVVVLGLLSTRSVDTPKGPGRLWLSLSFFFPPETLAAADTNSIFQTLDTWLARENQGFRGFAPQTATGTGATMAKPGEPAELKPGMSRAEVVEALGPPHREVSFAERTWLTYPGMVILFEEDKLVSVEDPNQARAQVTVSSDPDATSIYLNDQFVGSTPATLSLKAGTYTIMLRHPDYEPWEEKILVLAGSKLTLGPHLKKLAATSPE